MHIARRILTIGLALFAAFLAGGPAYAESVPVRIAAHVGLSVLLAVWLILRIRRRQFLPVTPLNIPLSVGAAVIALAVAFSVDTRMAAEHA